MSSNPISAQATRKSPRRQHCILTTKTGFEHGRAKGKELDVLYAAAAATGFAVGVAEAAIEALSSSVGWLFGDAACGPAG